DESKFTGYDTLVDEVRIARYRRVTTKGKSYYQIVFDHTPFYGNSGGQVGDVGFIEADGERVAVTDTQKENGLTVHITDKMPSNVEATFHAEVDAEKRQSSANNHTATHLLHAALRKVLGTHVEQKGSMVSPAGLRFDFSHFQKVTNEQLREVEQLVNVAIRANNPLDERRECPIDEAREAGAMMLFGEKYGDKVRMVRFGESVELCGGTHTSATGNIGMFKILSESAISAGVRRIEAVTGVGAEKVLYAAEDTIRQIEEFFHNSKIVPAIKRLIESNEALSQEVEQMHREQISAMAEQLSKACPEVDGMQLIARTFERPTEFVKDLAYNLRAKMPRLVLVAGSVAGGKATLTIMLGDEIVASGANASQVVRTAAKEINGGGGGQPFFATAGGKNPEGMQKAIDVAVELIKNELNK
ncbi:MAG: alanine--tRNA ligase, partial [Rikenellaceae bacterium]|nr:alanine--tRNA ligase [Rikenellaceae bacterium]